MRRLLLSFIVVFLASSPLYAFEAEVTSVIDGDTFHFDAKLLNVVVRGKCRALHYNAPERSEKGYAEAADKLSELIEYKTVEIKAEKADNYGRWLCDVWHEGVHINAVMRQWLEDIGYKDVGRYDYLE